MKHCLNTVLLSLALAACGGGGESVPDADTARVETAALKLGSLLGLGASPVSAGGSAPTASGPALDTPVNQLDAALSCSPNLAQATRPPVLLIPGIFLNPDNQYSWNWVLELDRLQIPHCELRLPNENTADLQVSAEYLVHAIRQMASRSQQKVQVVGSSTGGMLPRWVLRFWPDTRPLVEDVISLAGAHHGALLADGVCAAGCQPAVFQARPNSNFLRALNAGFETLPELPYTSVYTRTDIVLFPSLGPGASAILKGGDSNVVNVATQDICPLNIAENLLAGTSDPVVYAVAMDAIQHPGPANPQRIDRAVCAQLGMPAVPPASVPVRFAATTTFFGTQLALQPKVWQEPALRCYASGSC